MEYVIYVCDVETTGLDSRIHDVIELSLYRLNDDVQRTWCLKPLNIPKIDSGALRVNGHKLEDLKHETKIGRETYFDPNKVLVDIENWTMEDNVNTDHRILCGQNIAFDRDMLKQLWVKCGAEDTFPFSHRTMDTMIWAFMMDYAQGSMADNYSLSNLTKRYGIKNEKAHTAAADVKATKELFEKQVLELRSKLSIK